MGCKKILIASIIACSICGFFPYRAFCEDAPILLNPDKKDKTIKFIGEGDLKKQEKPTSVKTLSSKIQYNRRYKGKKIVRQIEQKPSDIQKLIEYNDFEQADKFIKTKMNANSKDITYRALWLVSLAKQCKLDPAQSELDRYLKSNPKNPDLHYAQGIVYFKRTTSSNMEYRANSEKLLKQSLEEFKKAIELNPKDARFYNAAGVISLGLGQTKEAKDYFKKAVEIDKTYSTALDNLGTIDFMDGKLNEAEKYYNKALLYNSGNTTAMYHLAQIANLGKEYSKAITHLNNAIYINPEAYTAHNLMGEIYDKQGNEAAAINSFKKAIAIRPEYSYPYLNLAEIYEKRGDSEFAIEQLKTALGIDPDFYEAKLKIADISLSCGKYDQAVENYSSLVGIEEFNDEALKGLANTYFEKAKVSSSNALISSNRDLFNALNYINKAIESNPSDLELHLAKLKLSQLTNQPAMSYSELLEITRSNKTDLTSLITKGEAYLALGKNQEAQKMFDLANNSVKTIEDELYLAEIYIYQRQYTSAKTVLQNILKKDATNQQALRDLDYIKQCEKNSLNYLNSAEFFIKEKNHSSAIEALSHSIALNVNNPKAYLLLAQQYEIQKNYPVAIENYKKYLDINFNAQDKNRIESKIKVLEKSTKIIQ